MSTAKDKLVALRLAARKQLLACLDGAGDVPVDFVEQWELLEAQQLGGLMTKQQESAYRQRIFELKRALKNPQAELKQCILSGSITPAELARTTDLLNPERKSARDAQRPIAVYKVDKEAERQARQYARAMGRGGSDAGDSDSEAASVAEPASPNPSPEKVVQCVVASPARNQTLAAVKTPKAKPIRAVQSALKKHRSLKIARHASGGLVVQEAAPNRADRESPRTKMLARMAMEPPQMQTPPYIRDRRARQREQEEEESKELAKKLAKKKAYKDQQAKKQQKLFEQQQKVEELKKQEQQKETQVKQEARAKIWQKDQEQQKLLEAQQRKIAELEAAVLKLQEQKAPRSPCPTLQDLGLASPAKPSRRKSLAKTPKPAPKRRVSLAKTPKAAKTPKPSARRKSAALSPKPPASPKTAKTIKKVRIAGTPQGAKAGGKKKSFVRTPHPNKKKPTPLCDLLLVEAGLAKKPASPKPAEKKLFAKKSNLDLSKLGLVVPGAKDKPRLFAKRSKVPLLGIAKEHVGLDTPKKRLSAASAASLSTAASTGRASTSSAGTPQRAPLSAKKPRLSQGGTAVAA